MKFKNGSPKVLYVLTIQEDGSFDPYTSLREAKKQLAFCQQHGYDAVLGKYDLREAK